MIDNLKQSRGVSEAEIYADVNSSGVAYRTYCDREIISASPALSLAASTLIEEERTTPLIIVKDTTIRCKVGDPCGLTCVFCHNEGTPVIPPQRARGRVSIYEKSNGVTFVPGLMEPGKAFAEMLENMINGLGTAEIHWTGGEPTLNKKLAELTGIASGLGLMVKMTSNGETGGRCLKNLHATGLKGINFSIFGTTPEELAQIQGPLFANEAFGKRQISRLNEAMQQAMDYGIPISANIVMSGEEHAGRVKRLIDFYHGTPLKIRILDDLGVGYNSSISIYNLLAELGATPFQRKLTAGASGSVAYYRLPDGQEIGFKQIRDARLPTVCNSCRFNTQVDCREGYYGVRVYVDSDGVYRVGVCIQRMDLTLPLEKFFASDLPLAIKTLRDEEFARMTSYYQANGEGETGC